ncbi:hypothetical protein HMPREF1579_00256 [Gardnerella vaginalis JCP8066]|nr:hypothetical protein HMPREF1579_00256 [Gardnerella vaginalis JCP8066]
MTNKSKNVIFITKLPLMRELCSTPCDRNKNACAYKTINFKKCVLID